MRQYELTYLISDNVPESDLNKVTGKVGGYVNDGGGKLLKEEIWGRRKLAYPIQKLEFATYVTVNFDLPSDKAKAFEHNIQMTSKIVRHLMTVKDFGEEKLTLTQEDIAEAAEITEVIGGEKSFEVVEGETEESKDLMAVRGSTTQISDTDLAQEQSKIEDVEENIKVSESAEEEKEVTEDIVTENPEEVVEKKGTKAVKKEKKSEEPAVKAEKKEKKAAPRKAKDAGTEADRLTKLDKELDDILGDDL